MCRGRHAFGRGWVGGSSCWAAADDADSSDSCGEFLLPAPADADGLYTQWRVCNNDCSLGEMITCYPQTEDEMLEDVGADHINPSERFSHQSGELIDRTEHLTKAGNSLLAEIVTDWITGQTDSGEDSHPPSPAPES